MSESRSFGAVALGASVALSAAFLDLFVSVLSAPEDLGAWRAVLPPLALTFGIVLALVGAFAALAVALPA
jgi:hypothetical protein